MSNKEEITKPKPEVIIDKKATECKTKINSILEEYGYTFKVNVVYQVDIIKK